MWLRIAYTVAARTRLRSTVAQALDVQTARLQSTVAQALDAQTARLQSTVAQALDAQTTNVDSDNLPTCNEILSIFLTHTHTPLTWFVLQPLKSWVVAWERE